MTKEAEELGIRVKRPGPHLGLANRMPVAPLSQVLSPDLSTTGFLVLRCLVRTGRLILGTPLATCTYVVPTQPASAFTHPPRRSAPFAYTQSLITPFYGLG